MSSNRMEIIPDLNEPYMICQHNTHQTEIPAEDVSIGFTAPISGDVDHANRVVDVAGAIVAADTEKLLFEKHRHQVEVHAQDACIGFTAPISRDVDLANEVADVAGAIVPADTENLLFEKHRHFWEVAESVEACKKMPQDPHFLPLKPCNENLREGQALGKMVTFDNIAKKTSNLHRDTKREAMKDDLSVLEELETHGFDVEILKDRLNRMMLLKNQEEKTKNMLEQKKRRLTGHDQKKCKNREKRAKTEEKIKEVQKEVELAAKKEKDMDAKIASEQLAERERAEKLRSINIQMEELIDFPLH